MATLHLPVAGGRLAPYTTRPSVAFPPAAGPLNRIAYAATHVVGDPLADGNPWLDAAVGRDRTTAYRRYPWSLRLGVAEAMDTAQRGMGMDWPRSLELIRRSLDAARDVPGALLASGVGTDHLEPGADAGRALARRLRQGLRPHPAPAQGQGDHPLARRDVRSRACRLLGPCGSR